VLFWVGVAAGLLPLLLFDFLPTSDGPAHVYNSTLLTSYFSPNGSPERLYFMPNPGVPPNLIGHLLAALAMLLVNPLAAEKVLIGIYVVGLPLAFRYALRAVSTRTEGLECLIFPFVYNMHLHWGFYNFCYGLMLYLVGLGFFLRLSGRPGVFRWFALATILLLNYLSHILGLAELGVSILILVAFQLWTRARSWRDSKALMLFVGSASLPSAVVYGQFLLRRLHIPGELLEWPTLKYAAYNLLCLAPIATFTRAERLIALGVAAFLAILIVVSAVAAVKLSKPKYTWAFMVASGLLSIFVFVFPVSALGGTMLTPRLVYFPVFLLCLWLTANSLPSRTRALCGFIGVFTAIALMLARLPVYSVYSQTMNEFLAVGQYMEPRKTLMFQTLADPFPQNLDPLTRQPNLSGAAGGYLTALHQDILLTDYEAETNHFPFLFRPAMNPGKLLPAANGIPIPCSTLRDYQKQSARPVDYLIVWNPDVRPERELEAEYQPCGYKRVGPDNTRVHLLARTPEQ
jgi:hypothetical protein